MYLHKNSTKEAQALNNLHSAHSQFNMLHVGQ